MRERLRRDRRRLWRGDAPLVSGVRFILFCATALWVPVLLLPGDTTRTSLTYATIRQLATWLDLPPVDGLLSPGELLLALVALALTLFAVFDYAVRGSRLVAARVYLATIFWVGVAASYLIANPIAYGTWIFIGFAFLSGWCLRAVRSEGGEDGDRTG